jgi:D-beta-D-heptose 7-phosphate kinase/D-beta-D-heptose 1-phosphate adenosyltransferase
MLGGAGNAVSNLASLGAKVQLISIVGDDGEGQTIKALLQSMGISPDSLVIDLSRPTSIKTRFLAGHQQLLRSDYESAAPVSDAIAEQIIARFSILIKDVQAVILSDYGKGLLRPDIIAACISKAQALNIPVIVDPKGKDFSIYKGATAVTPNKKELSEATQNHPVKTDEDIEAAARIVIQSCGIQSVIATRSAEGMSVMSAGKPILHIRQSRDIEVFDVSGAGDTVIATIAAAIASGASLGDAATLATYAGSIAVTKVGTTPVRLVELQVALESTGHSRASQSRTYQAPLQDIESALDDIKRWRAQGLKIGFTNGCFDIVHAGHVTYLNEARALCDRLIVGLNSDQSVKVLKGPERPIHDEIARATVLGALASVDSVILFGAEKAGDDNTAIALLNALKPDIYFKGGDYKVDDVPETPTVRTNGGEVRILSNIEGYSTTNAITKIKTASS